jgi:hypothetical protein
MACVRRDPAFAVAFASGRGAAVVYLVGHIYGVL